MTICMNVRSALEGEPLSYWRQRFKISSAHSIGLHNSSLSVSQTLPPLSIQWDG